MPEILELVQPVAFLPGPFLVMVLALVALLQGRQARAWFLPAAIPVSLLSVTCPIVVNAAAYISGFQAIAMTGAGGAGFVAALGLPACRSLRAGTIGLAAGLCLVALVHVVIARMRPRTTGAPPRPASAGLAVVMSLAVAVSVVGAALLFWLHLNLVDRLTMASDRGASQGALESAFGAAGIGDVSAIARSLQLLVFSGVPLSGLLVAVPLAALLLLVRREPVRAARLLLTGVLVTTVLGSGWAVVRLNGSMREIDRIATAAARAEADRNNDRAADAFLVPPPPPPGGAQPGVAGGVEGGIDGGVVGGVVGGLPEAPPPPPSQAPVRVGGTIKQPVKTRDVKPIYPAIAHSAGVQGVVIIEATIGPNGKVQDARVLRSIPLLDQAALEAVRQWEFTPTLLNGLPVPIIMTVTVPFALQ
jgi:TonB family protein